MTLDLIKPATRPLVDGALRSMWAEGAEVYHSDASVLRIGAAEIEALKALARANPSGKVRLCAHHRPEDSVHEMLIVHQAHTYVRPHKHLDKTESFHVIEGRCEVILFDEAGRVTDLVELGPFASGLAGYYRLSASRYHALLIRSEILVFHETTQGPFRREDGVFAPWSPEPGDAQGVARYLAALAAAVAMFKHGNHEESR